MVYLEYISVSEAAWSMCVCTRHDKWPSPTAFECIVSQTHAGDSHTGLNKWIGEKPIEQACSALDMLNTPISITLMMRDAADIDEGLTSKDVAKLVIACEVLNGMPSEFRNQNGDVVEPSDLPVGLLEDFILKQFLIKLLYDRISNTQVNNIIEAMSKTHAGHCFGAIEHIIRYQLNKQIREK